MIAACNIFPPTFDLAVAIITGFAIGCMFSGAVFNFARRKK